MTVESSTIGSLTPYEASMLQMLQDFQIPTEYGEGNYSVKVKDILTLVTKAFIGLVKVNNTADVDKPVSARTMEALALKANISHQHTLGDMPEVENRLRDFRLLNVAIPLNDVEGLAVALANLMPKDWRPTVDDVTGLNQVLSGKSTVGHNHDIMLLAGFDQLMQKWTLQLSYKAETTAVEQMISDSLQHLSSTVITDREDLSTW